MLVVWKYAIPMADRFDQELPFGAKVLCVQMQSHTPEMWVLVESSEDRHEIRQFRLAGTGHEIESSDCHLYIGTFQLREGALVFHLFETQT